MNKYVFVILLSLCFGPYVYAQDVVEKYIANAKQVGEGRLTFMLFDVYDAILMAPNGEWNNEQPFALELRYLRKIEGKKIAERSVQEMRDQGHDDEVKLAVWHSQMRNIFPDVDDGPRLIGIRDKAGNTLFYSGDDLIGRIEDTEFTQAFFNIWLSEQTSSPDLRRKLLRQ